MTTSMSVPDTERVSYFNSVRLQSTFSDYQEAMAYSMDQDMADFGVEPGSTEAQNVQKFRESFLP